MKEQAQPDVLPDVDQVIQRCIDAVRDADCPFFATTAINDAVYTMRLMQDHITQLAQRERPALTEHFPLTSPDCWCETCDMAANGGFRSRMSLCPSCGDKRCQRSIHHINACDKEPT